MGEGVSRRSLAHALTAGLHVRAAALWAHTLLLDEAPVLQGLRLSLHRPRASAELRPTEVVWRLQVVFRTLVLELYSALATTAVRWHCLLFCGSARASGRHGAAQVTCMFIRALSIFSSATDGLRREQKLKCTAHIPGGEQLR